ncbi:hypothetical protein HGRIS_001158 [Hohenbuehelia grisea]|uniref:Uncharacterized protein n=1 Tax=Hohenbuehelia grisea TaxID=104357 RepID=A0ABR3JP13_9AGAR
MSLATCFGIKGETVRERLSWFRRLAGCAEPVEVPGQADSDSECVDEPSTGTTSFISADVNVVTAVGDHNFPDLYAFMLDIDTVEGIAGEDGSSVYTSAALSGESGYELCASDISRLTQEPLKHMEIDTPLSVLDGHWSDSHWSGTSGSTYNPSEWAPTQSSDGGDMESGAKNKTRGRKWTWGSVVGKLTGNVTRRLDSKNDNSFNGTGESSGDSERMKEGKVHERKHPASDTAKAGGVGNKMRRQNPSQPPNPAKMTQRTLASFFAATSAPFNKRDREECGSESEVSSPPPNCRFPPTSRASPHFIVNMHPKSP